MTSIKTFLSISFVLVTLIFSCVNNSEIRTQVEIDPDIKLRVLEEILDTFQNQRGCSYLFLSKENTNYHLNDSLFEVSKDTIDFKQYEASWIINGDTTLIVGNEVRSDGTFGFQVEIIDNKAKVLGYLRTHVLLNNLSIDTTEKKYYNSILIPTSKSKVILSKMPNLKIDEEIFGYLEFQTNEFYTFENSNQPESEIKVENRIKIYKEIYFKSTRCSKW